MAGLPEGRVPAQGADSFPTPGSEGPPASVPGAAPGSGRTGSISHVLLSGFPGGASGKEPACQRRRHKRRGFDPWVGKVPWRRSRQPTPVFLPGESHGQRSLAGYSPWGRKESDTTEATWHTHMLLDSRLASSARGGTGPRARGSRIQDGRGSPSHTQRTADAHRKLFPRAEVGWREEGLEGSNRAGGGSAGSRQNCGHRIRRVSGLLRFLPRLLSLQALVDLQRQVGAGSLQGAA